MSRFLHYGCGVGDGVGSGSPRFLSFGGPSDDDELLPESPSVESVVESGSGCRRFNVGLPLSSSLMSVVTPALAFVIFIRCDLTR